MRRLDWNSVTCGVLGHVTYLPDEPRLAARLSTDTPVGTATRCLRCGTFVPGDARGHGPADDAPVVPRGRALEDAFILRVLAVLRFAHFVGFAVLAAAVWTFRHRKVDLASAFYGYLPLVQPLAQRLGVDLGSSRIIAGIERALSTAPHTLSLIIAALIAYAALELAEAVGLWLMQRWGEYVAAVGTSALVPYEIYEIVHKPTPFKIAALLVNLAAVAYLLWTKRLFGLRGGRAAYVAERHAQSLLEVERAAAARDGEALLDDVEQEQRDGQDRGKHPERARELAGARRRERQP